MNSCQKGNLIFFRKYFVVGLFLLHPCLFFFAQNFNSQPVGKNFTIDDGLPSNECYQVFQDSKKRIWIATDNGVACYNSGKFRVYTTESGLIDNVVFEFYEDKNGRIWFIGATNELCYFDGKQIKPYKFNHVLRKNITVYSVPDKDMIFTSQGDLYLSIRHKGIFRINSSGKFSNFSKGKNAIIIQQIEGERLWNTYHEYYNVPLRFDIINSVSKTAIKLGSEPYRGKIYIDQRSDFLSTEFAVYNLKTNKKISNQQGVIHVYANDKHLFLSTRADGVYLLDKGTFKVVEHILPEIAVSSSITDHQGGIWCTSLENGLYYFHPNPIRKINLGGMKTKVTSVVHFNNTYYIGKNGSEWLEISNEKINLFKSSIGSVKFYRSKKGVLRLDGQGIYFENNWISKNWIGGFYDKGDYFIYGYLDIYRNNFKGDEELIYDFRHDSALKNKQLVNAIVVHDNRIWVGGTDGLYFINNGKLERASFFNKGSTVKHLLNDNKWGLIAGTSRHGLVVFNSKRINLKQTDNLKSIGIQINAMTFGSEGDLFVSSEKGIFHIQSNNHEISLLSDFPLFKGKQVNTLHEKNGNLLIGTNSGLFSLNFKELLHKNRNNDVVFDYISIQSDKKEVSHNSNVSYDYDANFIIHFSSTDYNAYPNFRYKLAGQDDWSYVQTPEININNYKKGSYVLIISQLKHNGHWSENKRIYAFEIKSPFWETGWFYSGSGVLALGSLFLIFIRFNKRRIKKIELENRTLIAEHSALKAQMNPHFFFNVLNSIQSKILYNENDAALDYLSKFARLSRSMIGNSRSAYHTVSEEIQFLTQYLELESMRFNEVFKWKISHNLNKMTYARFIPAMIIQPIVENAIVHGFNNKIKGNILEISIDEIDINTIEIIVMDNGKGVHIEGVNRSGKKSYGLTIVKERLSLMCNQSNNFYLKVINRKDLGQEHGTIVIVRLPIIENIEK